MDIDFSLIVPEIDRVERKVSPYGMNKIVDVEKVLKLLSFRAGFSFVIKVEDDSLDWNNDSFKVSFGAGKTLVERTEEEADLSCDVRALTRFLIGYTSLEKEYEYGNLEIRDKKEELFELFPNKKLFMTEGY